MPLMLAWALSCLILSASFQNSEIATQAQITKQSPLAQFNHAGNNYSLRFNGAKLYNANPNSRNNDTDGDDVSLVLSFPLSSFASTVVDAPHVVYCFNKQTSDPYRLRPRGPPYFLS
ncbi:hypothetical protein [Alteromonas gracilis]|uniref:hypothetical protein n=1 Tax=Alteromonas gracilis TaxID=1479524 RepID=UPI0030D091AD